MMPTTLVIAPSLRDAEDAKRFGLVPDEAKYIPSTVHCYGYKHVPVYIVNWPPRWLSGMSRTELIRLNELSRIQTYLQYCGCTFTSVTLP